MNQPTFAAEDTLPRVPLPTLDDSCARFLQWCQPLLGAEEYATTEGAVAELLRPGGAGRALHAALAEYDATPGVGSWLDEFWPSRYLGRRDRIAINANFVFLFRDDTPSRRRPSPGRPSGQPRSSARLSITSWRWTRRRSRR